MYPLVDHPMISSILTSTLRQPRRRVQAEVVNASS